MSPKTSQMVTEEEDTRGCRGCFGWFFKLFKRIKRRRKHKNPEPSLTPLTSNVEVLENADEKNESVMIEMKVTEEENGQAEACSAATAAEEVGEERQKEKDDEELVEEQEPKVVMTWAEEVDDAEEKGLDVFAPLSSCLPHTAIVHSEISASTENEAAANNVKMSASQKRRARRSALAAAHFLRASPENEVAASIESEVRPPCAETIPSADSCEEPPAPDTTSVWPTPSAPVSGSDGRPPLTEGTPAAATSSRTSATKRRRARRKALAAAKTDSEARLAANTEEPPAPDGAHVCPSPSVRVFGSDGRPFVTTWEDAAYGAFHGRRHYSGMRGSVASTEEPPAPDGTPVWPSPSVRVFGSDGRPFVTTWEEAAYGAFHARRHY